MAQKSGPAKTFFGLKVVMAVPPPTAFFVEAVLFLNHCGCAVWSATLLFSNPQRQFFSRHGSYILLLKLKNSVLKCSCAVLRLNSEHTNSGRTCITFVDEKPFS